MNDETSKRIEYLHSIVMVLMMNLEDDTVDENCVKEQIIALVEKIVEELELFVSSADEGILMSDIKKVQRVIKKLKKEFSI